MSVSPAYTVNSPGSLFVSTNVTGIVTVVATLNVGTDFFARVSFTVAYSATAPTSGVVVQIYDMVSTVVSSDWAYQVQLPIGPASATRTSRAVTLAPGIYQVVAVNLDGGTTVQLAGQIDTGPSVG